MILKQLNESVYKPLGRGQAQIARRAAREQIRQQSNVPTLPWVQRPSTTLWDSLSETWTLHDIALFEASFSLYGKDFVSIQQIVTSKTMHEIVDFFYLWKMTSHYRIWKDNVRRTKNEKAAAEAAAKAAAEALSLERNIGASNLPLRKFWDDESGGKGKKGKGNKADRKRARAGSSSSGNKGGKRSKKIGSKTKNGGIVLAKLHGIEIKPEALKEIVNSLGGIATVRGERKWQIVRVALKLQQTSSSGHTLNKAWERYFE